MDSLYLQLFNPKARFDWLAALQTGLIACGVMWLFSHGLPWFTSGMISPTMVGRDLKPASAVDPARSLMTVAVLFGVSLVYALILALIVTRFRGLWAIAVGGVVGLGLFYLNQLIFEQVASVDWTGAQMPVLVAHVVFGLIAAGLYKGLARRSVLPENARPPATT